MTTKTFGGGAGGDAGGPAPAFKLTNSTQLVDGTTDNFDGSSSNMPGSILIRRQVADRYVDVGLDPVGDWNCGVNVDGTNPNVASSTYLGFSMHGGSAIGQSPYIDFYMMKSGDDQNLTLDNVNSSISLRNQGDGSQLRLILDAQNGTLQLGSNSFGSNQYLSLGNNSGVSVDIDITTASADVDLQGSGAGRIRLDTGASNLPNIHMYGPSNSHCDLLVFDTYGQVTFGQTGQGELTLKATYGATPSEIWSTRGLRLGIGTQPTTLLGSTVSVVGDPVDASFIFETDSGQYGEDAYFELRCKPSTGSGVQLPVPKLKFAGSTWRSTQGQPWPFSCSVYVTCDEYNEIGFVPTAFRVSSDNTELFHVADRLSGGVRARQFSMAGNGGSVEMQAGPDFAWLQCGAGPAFMEIGVPSGATVPRIYAAGTYLTFMSGAPNAFGAIGYLFNTEIQLSEPTAKVFLVQTASFDRFSVFATGDVELPVDGKGVILKTPDGTKRYRLSIDNAGAVVTTLLA